MLTSSIKLTVRYQETDRMGIVYYSNYFVWFEIGRTELFKKAGISYSQLEREGYYLVVTEANCSYKAPATYDEELEVITRLTGIKNSTLSFDYEVRKGGSLITTGSTNHAFINARGKAVKIPAVVAAL